MYQLKVVVFLEIQMGKMFYPVCFIFKTSSLSLYFSLFDSVPARNPFVAQTRDKLVLFLEMNE